MFALFKKQGFQTKKKQRSPQQRVFINTAKLKTLLGGTANIIQVKFTPVKIKVYVKAMRRVDVNGIGHLRSVTGMFLSRHYITIIVGKQAKELATLLIKP